jgi:hypothetical protein
MYYRLEPGQHRYPGSVSRGRRHAWDCAIEHALPERGFGGDVEVFSQVTQFILRIKLSCVLDGLCASGKLGLLPVPQRLDEGLVVGVHGGVKKVDAQ